MSNPFQLATQSFLDSLDDEQRSLAVFPFASEERLNWHFIPRPRKGLCLKQMSNRQREAAFRLIGSVLSADGEKKIRDIIRLEGILGEIEDRRAFRDTGLYFLSVFGEPGDDRQGWGWRVEGHHISLNISFHPETGPALTPAFLGANPAQVPHGTDAGMRVLGAQEDLGRRLVLSLDERQRRKAIYSETAPPEILTAGQPRANLDGGVGIRYSDLDAEQGAHVWNIIDGFFRILKPDLAEQQLDRVREHGLESLYFAWAGGTDPGEGHYYRLHGPVTLIEYDNTQNQANHIHTVWRDPKYDFGPQ